MINKSIKQAKGEGTIFLFRILVQASVKDKLKSLEIRYKMFKAVFYSGLKKLKILDILFIWQHRFKKI